MASLQQAPEIQFAQRLASNEKPIRTRAIKKLRKYIRVRSQRLEGGFSDEELLKLWKGLFYCLWMQDKPLLQEELSNQIAGLLHNFQNVDMQFLYLETFLQTMKREWTGIDRLRMDKFYQLVRFVFRQTFEMLKRSGWETSLVSTFLELLTVQVLSKSGAAPCGLQIHILDLYLTELAGVGTAQLNAEQNLTFIEPFCKTAAKTKDRVLLGTICNIFRAIIDQAPFAVEDLLKEMKAAGAEDSDSGQASEEEDSDSGQASEEEEGVQKITSKLVGKKALKKSSKKQMNGTTSTEELDDDDEEDEDDELLHLEDGSDTELADEEMGPVLQFDYGALADRLFKLAGFNNTPSYNRQKLYKIIKTFRDLSEGIFPQDEYPEETSTDEDDDEMFGSRTRMKRGRVVGGEEEEGVPATKKAKGKKEASKPGKSDASKPVDDISDTTNKKKKKKRKKKAKMGEEKGGDVKEQTGQEEEKVAAITGQKDGSEVKAMDTASVEALLTAESDNKDIEQVQVDSLLKVQTENSALSEAAVASAEMESQSETSEPATVIVGSQSVVTITDSDSEPDALVTGSKQEDQSETRAIEEPLNQSEELLESASSKKKRRKKCEPTSEESEPSVEVAEEQPAPGTHDEEPAEGVAQPESIPETATTSTNGAKKKKRKSNKLPREMAEMEAKSSEAELNQVFSSPVEEEPPTEDSGAAPRKTKRKKPKQRDSTQEECAETDTTHAETLEAAIAADEVPADAAPLKKKKSKAARDQVVEPQLDADATCTEEQVITATPIKKKKRKAAAEKEEAKSLSQPEVEESCEHDELPTSLKKSKKKKRKYPVVVEVEADELEAAENSLAGSGGKKTKISNEPSSSMSTKKSSKLKVKKSKAGSGNAFITFQGSTTVPTPLFFRTPPSSNKKCQTPKSDSKKVTFGLMNNKTAEFRKNDRSLLVSPEGSSRVPFNPEQKPVCGVLKFPSPVSTKKIPKIKKTPTGRPTAADFF